MTPPQTPTTTVDVSEPLTKKGKGKALKMAEVEPTDVKTTKTFTPLQMNTSKKDAIEYEIDD